MIRVRELRKHYEVHERPPGLAAAVRSLFRRSYKTVAAVDGIDFDIAPGERVGFLGPNGAGKTTTLKMLAGLLHPTAGEASVLGFEPRLRSRELLRSIMLVTGQKQQLLWDLPPADTFELNRAIYDVPRAQFRNTLDELVLELDLGDLIQKPTRQLSLGERMKCELAAALLHGPKVLFLDEPTIGLDVTMQATVRRFVKSHNERTGATVILTSHYMEDVVALCPRVIVIDHGKLSWDGALDELVRGTRPEKRVALRLGAPASKAQVDALGAKVIEHDDAQVVLQVQVAQLSEVLSRALGSLAVDDLTVEAAPLEEVLSDLFRKSREAREAQEGPTSSQGRAGAKSEEPEA
jgi:ABC-2 type transport system ATP-binding protein